MKSLKTWEAEMSYKAMLLLIFLSVIASSSTEDPLAGHRCTFISRDDGFKCLNGGGCIPLKWVCDDEEQCEHPDTSDEGFGCNLFPETGCKSIKGERHVKCPDDSNRCVKDLSDCSVVVAPGEGGGPQEEKANHFCDDPQGDKGGEGFRCQSGLCVQKALACNGKTECDDGSDESVGCDLFPEEEEESCASWFGERHVRCTQFNNTLDSRVCTLEKFNNLGDCRKCEDDSEWRCDSGECIAAKKWEDGIKDCADGTDENIFVMSWWMLFLITLVTAVAGIALSFCCRFCQESCFQCGLCTSTRSKRARALHALRPAFEMADLHAKCDATVCSQYKESAVFFLPVFELSRLLEDPNNWQKECIASASLEVKGKFAYAKIHQDPVLYRTLYTYLCTRLATPSERARVVGQLHRWEMEFHCQTATEAVACWRLHIGSTKVLKAVIRAMQAPGYVTRFRERYQPIKDSLRKVRQTLPAEVKEPSERLYAFTNIVYYLIKPLCDVFCFYFDVAKDITFTWIIFTCLHDLTQEDYSPAKYPFETCLVATCIVAVIFAGLSLAGISCYYANEIFDMCDEHGHPERRFGPAYRVFSVLLFPLMPAFVLANRVYYLQQAYVVERELQTMEWGVAHTNCQTEESQPLSASPMYPAAPMLDGMTAPSYIGEVTKRLALLDRVQKKRHRANSYRRIYSFYRVANAVILSFTMIAVVWVILLEGNRHVNLIQAVTEKIGDFLRLQNSGSVSGADNYFLDTMSTARDIVIAFSVLYSAVMIITAMVRYIYLSKCGNIIVGGIVFLSLYVFCHMNARLTLFIAMFATSGSSSSGEGEGSDSSASHAIASVPAAIMALFVVVVHFVLIYLFKKHFVPNFSKCGDTVEKLVHVLVNTVVVLPYDPIEKEDDIIAVKDNGHSRMSYPPLHLQRVTSFPPPNRRCSTSRLLDDSDGVPIRPNLKKQVKHTKSVADVDRSPQPPQLNSFAFPNVAAPLALETGDVDEVIVDMWWERPDERLRWDRVWPDLLNLPKCPQAAAMGEAAVKETFDNLEKNGFINKSLRLPQRTKREYFWLLLMHLLFSTVALTVELVNGGTKLQSTGKIYYSWDIRAVLFVLGLIFLLIYYKRYHMMRNLINEGGCLSSVRRLPGAVCSCLGCSGCSEESPVQAAPGLDIMRNFLREPNLRYLQDGCEPDSGRRQMCDMMTQTSTVELPKPEEEEKNNETDDEKKKKEGDSNGGVVREKKEALESDL